MHKVVIDRQAMAVAALIGCFQVLVDFVVLTKFSMYSLVQHIVVLMGYKVALPVHKS